MRKLKARYASIVGTKSLKLTKVCKAWINRQKNSNLALRKLIYKQLLREIIPPNQNQTGYLGEHNQTVEVIPTLCGGCGKECRNGFGLGLVFLCPVCLKQLFSFAKTVKGWGVK